jgi:hypothetical protein
MPFVERRKSTRIYKKLKIDIENDERIHNLGSIDLSARGIRFRSNIKVPLFKQLTFKIDISEKNGITSALDCHATVIRCEKSTKAKGYQVTLFFHDLKKDAEKKIEKYIEDTR